MCERERERERESLEKYYISYNECQEIVEEEVRKSLKRLQVDYIDLVLIHTPAPRRVKTITIKT